MRSFCNSKRFFYYSVMMLIVMSGCEQEEEINLTPEIVRLYTSVPVKIVKEIKDGFEAEYKNISLDIHRTGTGKIMRRIKDEMSNGEVGADVIWVADFSNAEELKKSGVLQKYESPQSKKIFPLFKDPDGYYTGSRLLNMVIAYNTDYVKQFPESYKDLLKPEFHNRIGIVNPEISGASFYVVSSLMQDNNYGQPYFKALSANGVEIVKNNKKIVEKIANERISAGITIDFSVRNYLKEHPESAVDYVYPEKGTIVIASPIALTKASRENKASKQFIDWVLSTKGQSLLSQLGVAPVRSDVNVPAGMVSLGRLLVFPSDPELINKNRDLIIKKYHELFTQRVQ